MLCELLTFELPAFRQIIYATLKRGKMRKDETLSFFRPQFFSRKVGVLPYASSTALIPYWGVGSAPLRSISELYSPLRLYTLVFEPHAA